MADAITSVGSRIVVVDTSVVVKWYLADGEEQVSEALSYLVRHRDGALLLAAPELLLVEFIQVLKRRGLDARRVERSVDRLLAARLQLHSLASIAPAVAALVGSHAISAYDACFAALANRLDAPLVTADRRLARCGACDARLLGENEAHA